jgi:hypothetical protein
VTEQQKPEIKSLQQEKKTKTEPLTEKTKEKVKSVPIQSTLEF